MGKRIETDLEEKEYLIQECLAGRMRIREVELHTNVMPTMARNNLHAAVTTRAAFYRLTDAIGFNGFKQLLIVLGFPVDGKRVIQKIPEVGRMKGKAVHFAFFGDGQAVHLAVAGSVQPIIKDMRNDPLAGSNAGNVFPSWNASYRLEYFYLNRRTAAFPGWIVGDNQRYPFLPWDDLVHDFQKFFPFCFLFPASVFHIAKTFLFHTQRPLSLILSHLLSFRGIKSAFP